MPFLLLLLQRTPFGYSSSASTVSFEIHFLFLSKVQHRESLAVAADVYVYVYIGLLARDLKGNPTSFEKRQYWIRPALLCCSLFVSLARDRYVPRLAYLIIRHIDGSMSIRVSRIQLANVLFFRVLFLRRGYFLRILRNWIKVIPRSGSILKRR